jgi:putative alpha-1,2-mannosidase
MSERQIPHLRDIFGVPFDGVQYSPRSRRRRNDEQQGYHLAKHFNGMQVTDVSGTTTDPDSAVSVGSSGEEEVCRNWCSNF